MICTLNEWNQATEQETKIGIEPFTEECLSPVGYDLSVGEQYSSALRGMGTISEDKPVIIEPGDTVLIFSLEKVKMPKSKLVSALILSKVSQVSKGLSHIATTIDPDWQENYLLIAVHNHSIKNIKLEFKERFCTIVFFETKDASEKSSQTGGAERLANFVHNYDAEARRKLKQIERTNKEILIYHIISLSLIPLSIVVGYMFFQNKPELFITTAGLGATLSQTGLAIINNFLKK